MRERNSELMRKTRYEKKWDYWLSAGFYILFAAIWMIFAKYRLENSDKVMAVIALISAAGLLVRAGHEIHAYVRDKNHLYIKGVKRGRGISD